MPASIPDFFSLFIEMNAPIREMPIDIPMDSRTKLLLTMNQYINAAWAIMQLYDQEMTLNSFQSTIQQELYESDESFQARQKTEILDYRQGIVNNNLTSIQNILTRLENELTIRFPNWNNPQRQNPPSMLENYYRDQYRKIQKAKQRLIDVNAQINAEKLRLFFDVDSDQDSVSQYKRKRIKARKTQKKARRRSQYRKKTKTKKSKTRKNGR